MSNAISGGPVPDIESAGQGLGLYYCNLHGGENFACIGAYQEKLVVVRLQYLAVSSRTCFAH